MTKSNRKTLIWVAVLVGVGYYFKDKIVATYHSLTAPAGSQAAKL